jgi:hypothetical protein
MTRALGTLLLALLLISTSCGPKTPPSTWPVTVVKQTPASGDEWLELLGAPWNDSSVKDAIRRTGGSQRNGMFYDGKSLYLPKHRVILGFKPHPGRQPAGFDDDTLLLSQVDLDGDYRGGLPRGLDARDRKNVARITGSTDLLSPYFKVDGATLRGPHWIVDVQIGTSTAGSAVLQLYY